MIVAECAKNVEVVQVLKKDFYWQTIRTKFKFLVIYNKTFLLILK